MSKLILEIGPGPRPQAQDLWKGSTVETADLNPDAKPTYLVDASNLPEEMKGKYDIIFASHVLEHFPYFNSTKTLQHWAERVKPGGEIHVIVPSFEWAAKQALKDESSPAIMGALCGGLTTPWDVHLSQFTMRRLRAVFEAAGLKVVTARSGQYFIQVNGKDFPCEQHYVRGIKP